MHRCARLYAQKCQTEYSESLAASKLCQKVQLNVPNSTIVCALRNNWISTLPRSFDLTLHGTLTNKGTISLKSPKWWNYTTLNTEVFLRSWTIRKYRIVRLMTIPPISKKSELRTFRCSVFSDRENPLGYFWVFKINHYFYFTYGVTPVEHKYSKAFKKITCIIYV